MNKLVSIIRVAIVLVLSSFGFFFLLGEELDENLSDWMLHFLIDKTLAFLAILVVVRLYKQWRKTDPWFIAYEEWSRRGEDSN
ncbi:MAG: hypothetical protein HDS85_01720 [Bacteroidales bacterium]|nr:hypothetical protein [Bacteroidales bacterium]